jgi:hypothetical protein
MKKLPPNFINKVLRDLEKIPNGKGFEYIKIVMLWSILEGWASLNVGCTSVSDKIHWLESNPEDFLKEYDLIDATERIDLTNLANKLGLGVGKDKHLPEASAIDTIGLLYNLRNKISHGEWALNESEDATKYGLIKRIHDLIFKWIKFSQTKGRI